MIVLQRVKLKLGREGMCPGTKSVSPADPGERPDLLIQDAQLFIDKVELSSELSELTDRKCLK